MNINRASEAEKLPGVGKKKARRLAELSEASIVTRDVVMQIVGVLQVKKIGGRGPGGFRYITGSSITYFPGQKGLPGTLREEVW